MTREDWLGEYRRLVTAYNRSVNAEQASVYFAALSTYPLLAIEAAVTLAIRESRGWPSAAELAERAHGYLAGHQAPASICDLCHGDKFTITQCDGWHAVNGKAEPVNYQRLCKRDFPHARHEDAHPCRQCHPAARRAEPAA